MAGDIPVRPFTSLANEIGNAHLRRTPAEDKRGVQLISDVLPFGRLCCAEPNAMSNAVGYAQFNSRSHDALIHVFDAAVDVIETYQPAGHAPPTSSANSDRSTLVSRTGPVEPIRTSCVASFIIPLLGDLSLRTLRL